MATDSEFVGPELDLVLLAQTLSDHRVDYVLVGGLAAILHGATRATRDADLLIDSSTPNIERLLEVCRHLRVRHRTDNERLDGQLAQRARDRDWYVSDVQDIFLTLQTDVGPVDLLPSIALSDGRARFEDVSPVDARIGSGPAAVTVKVLSLDRLIESKRATGRPSDVEALPELLTIRQRKQAATLREGLHGFFAVFVARIVDEDLPPGCFMGDSSTTGGFDAGTVAETLQTLHERLAAKVHQRIEAALDEGELGPMTSGVPILQFVLGQIWALSAVSRSNPTQTQLDAVVEYMLAGLPWADTPRQGD